VTLNDRILGLYVLKEGIERTFLRRQYGESNGALFEPSIFQDISHPMELKSGDEMTGRQARRGLAKSIRNRDLQLRWQDASQYLDQDHFARFCAMEVFCWHWDGYYLNKNNYWLYVTQDTGEVRFIPDGMDQLFGRKDGPLQPRALGIVARKLNATPPGNEAYHKAMRHIMDDVLHNLALEQTIQQYYASSQPWLKAWNEEAADKQTQAMQKLIENLEGRIEFLRSALAEGGQ